MNSIHSFGFLYGKEELCKETSELFTGSISKYIVNMVDKLCETELKFPTELHILPDINEFFKTTFELEYLQNPDEIHVISSFNECNKDGIVSVLIIKFISYNDKNDLCIYYCPNSEYLVLELQEQYGDYICNELFFRKRKKED